MRVEKAHEKYIENLSNMSDIKIDKIINEIKIEKARCLLLQRKIPPRYTIIEKLIAYEKAVRIFI